jgi:hypothetical protein
MDAPTWRVFFALWFVFKGMPTKQGNDLRERPNRSVGVNTLDDAAHGTWSLLEQERYVVEVLKQLRKLQGEQDGGNGLGQGYRGFDPAGHMYMLRGAGL